MVTPNLAMWGHALRRMARPSREDWRDLDVVSRWLIAVRAPALLMTLLSASIAGILAWRDGGLDVTRWWLMTAGLLFAHATNNLLNDLVDFRKGVDVGDYFRNQYTPQPLAQGFLSAKAFGVYVALTGGAAAAIGAWLVLTGSSEVLWLFLGGAFFVLFYTWPLKHFGLGEPAVLLVWGPLMVGGGYFVVTGTWSWMATAASLPYALGVTTVLFGKHIDKFDADRDKGIRTLPVLLGHQTSRWSVIGMMVLQYSLVIWLVSTGYLTVWMLLVLLAIRPFYLTTKAYRQLPPDAPPPKFPEGVWPLWYVALAFWHATRFGAAFLLALVIGGLS